MDFATRNGLPGVPRALWRLIPGLRPKKRSLEQRLAQFPTENLPLDGKLTIRWNQHQVPFIEAESDRDLAFALGMVHAHLRGVQLMLFQRASQGRLSEMGGPFAKHVDHTLRIMSFSLPAEEIERDMPEATRVWTQAFADGITLYQERLTDRPPEMALLGVDFEPWSIRDVLIAGRLIGADFNWLTQVALLEKRGQPDFKEIWRRMLEAGASNSGTFRSEAQREALSGLIMKTNRAGSNSVAISPERSASGSAMLANDPHLGFALPNLWVLAGMKSPSYDVVGFMLPAMPFVCVGRNPDLAWGATNLRAASTDMYDVSKLPPEEFSSEETLIKNRFGFNSKMKIRRTRFGPVISDSKLIPSKKGESITMRWVGYQPTDEITAMLRLARARNAEEFRHAFVNYGVPGQNFLFAAKDGDIGKVMAVTHPNRGGFPQDDPVMDATDPKNDWNGLVGVLQLPHVINPPDGVLVSANNRPEDGEIPIGFLYAGEGRFLRIHEILKQKEKLSLEDLFDLQKDTRAPEAAVLGQGLLAEIDQLAINGPEIDGGAKVLLEALREWDGDYRADSKGPVAFEMLLYHVVGLLYTQERDLSLSDHMSEWNFFTTFLIQDLQQLPEEERRTLLKNAIEAAVQDAKRFDSWGEMHELEIAHVLANLPFVGKAYFIERIPIGGSRQTPMKMAHGLTNQAHKTDFGQMARHISDMADPDANWFVIVGGQDGWVGSENYTDQVSMWQAGDYIRMPLTAEKVQAEFPHVQSMEPTKSGPPEKPKASEAAADDEAHATDAEPDKKAAE